MLIRLLLSTTIVFLISTTATVSQAKNKKYKKHSTPHVQILLPHRPIQYSKNSIQTFRVLFRGPHIDVKTFSFTINGVEYKDKFKIKNEHAFARIRLEEGANNLKASISNRFSKVGFDRKKLILDTTGPEITFVDGAGPAYINEQYYFLHVKFKDAYSRSIEKSVRVHLDGENYTNKIHRKKLSKDHLSGYIRIAKEGKHRLRFSVSDGFKNRSSALKEVFVKRSPIVLSNLSPNSNETVITNTDSIAVSGKADSELVSANVNGLDFLVKNKSEFTGGLFFDSSGEKDITIKLTDIYGNKKTLQYKINLLFDKKAPTLAVSPPPTITNKETVSFTVKVTDENNTLTQVKHNGVELTLSEEKEFIVNANLSQNINTFEIKSKDIAENFSETHSFNVTLDTVMPFITWDTPQNNEDISDLDIYILGTSNEPLQGANINGRPLDLDSDKINFSGKITPEAVGLKELKLITTDLAGNQNEILRTVNVLHKVLNVELVSVKLSDLHEGLIVEGMKMSTRPETEITLTTSDETYTALSDSEGKFLIKTDYFENATIAAQKDGDSITDNLTFNLETKFAGILLDPMDNPLPGATVTILGTGDESSQITATTNQEGVFSFLNPPTGDQNVIIDGTTIDLGENHNKKYSIKTIRVNISFARDNTLNKPIYFAPLILDGTETKIVDGSSATVISPHAPGFELEVPADSVTFPDGSNTGAISVAIAKSDRTTVPPLEFAVPDEVYCLEPSGTKFSKDVRVTMPNVNEFPEGVELIILSMDSSKGTWDIDGHAKVDAGGQTITTLPGRGITHFSEIYAVPLMPVMDSLTESKERGINVSDGAVKTAINLPTYQVMGQDFGLNLKYDSSTAKPTAYISNYFDIPKQSIVFETSLNNTTRFEVSYRKYPWRKRESYIESITTNVSFRRENWYSPESLSFDFFINGVQTETTTFEGQNKSKSLGAETIEYKEIPYQTQVSYAFDLKYPYNSDEYSNEDEYFKSGIYPALSRYKLKFKHLYIKNYEAVVIGDRQGEIINRVDSSSGVLFENVFETNLKQNIIVDNQTNSSFGKGWSLENTKRILNPEAPRVVVSNGNSFITYAKNNVIKTLIDGDLRSVDFTQGVSFSQFPSLAVTQKNSNENTTNILKFDNQGNFIKKISQLPNYNGTIYASDCGDDTFRAPYSTKETTHPFNYKPLVNKIIELDNGRFLSIGTRDSSVFLFGEDSSPFYDLNVQTPLNGKTEEFTNQFCESIGTECPSTASRSAKCFVTGVQYYPIEYYIVQKGDTKPGTGRIGRSSAYINSPTDIILGPKGEFYLANTGLNKISKFNLDTVLSKPNGYSNFYGTTTTVAGNGKAEDNGNNGLATDASLYHPKGLVFDNSGNLYISTESGYIRKVDTSGVITHIAGLPLDKGGLLGNSVKAKEVYLSNPSGMAIDNDSNTLYVADTNNHRVVAIDLINGIANTVVGTSECTFERIGDNGAALNASLCNPTYLHLDPNKNLLIVDSGHNRLRTVNMSPLGDNTLTYLPNNKDLSLLSKNEDGTWMRELRSGVIEEYNQSGYITKETDLLGRILKYEYNNLNQLVSITDPVGEKTTFSYSGELLDSITDPVGRTTGFSYSDNKLTDVYLPDGTRKEYIYSPDGLLLEEINQRGLSKKYSYNAYNRLEKITYEDESSAQISDNISKTLANDDTGNNLKTYDPTADSASTVLTDAKGNISTKLDYDRDGYILTIEDPLGRRTHIFRNNEGNPEEIYGPNLYTYLEYDPITQDLLKQTTFKKYADTEGKVLNSYEYKYDRFGNVIEEISNSGIKKSRSIDSSTGLLISETNTNDVTTEYSYNSLGLVESITKPINGSQSLTINYEYGNLGRLIKITSSTGEEKIISYDDAGNVIEENIKKNDGAYDIKKYTHNSFNRLIQVENKKGEVTKYTYTPTGKISTVTDPKGQKTLFEYDERDRVIKKVYPNGQTWLYSYDKNSNLIYVKQPNGKKIMFEHDIANRVKRKILPDDIYNYSYNENDQVIYVSNNVSEINLDIDYKGRLLSESIKGKGDLLDYPYHQKNYTYNDLDLKESYSESFSGIDTQYSYYADGKLAYINSSFFGGYNFSYDNLDRVTQVQGPKINSEYNFGTESLLQSITHRSGSSTKAFFNYERDESGLIRKIASNIGEQSFTYDERNYLTSATHPENTHKKEENFANEIFEYDSIGNRTKDQFGDLKYGEYGYALDENYKYKFTYDLNGNLITKENKINGKTVKYGYTSENQLKKVTFLDSLLDITPNKEVSYFYDAVGRRIKKEVITGSTTSEEKYIYDAQEVSAKLDKNNNVTARYLHSGLRTDDVLAVSYTNEGVSAGLAKSAGNYFYLKDHIGTIKHIVNQNGDVIQTNNYSAYGVLTSVQDNQGIDIAQSPNVEVYHAFTGREWDKDADLYYYRARFYDASTGRFIQQDPHPGKTNIPETITNRYTYATNNPLTYSDPSGKFIFVAGAIIGAAVLSTATLSTVATVLVLALTAAAFTGAIAEISTINQGGTLEDVYSSGEFWTSVGVSFIGALAGGATLSYFGLLNSGIFFTNATLNVTSIGGAATAGALYGAANAATQISVYAAIGENINSKNATYFFFTSVAFGATSFSISFLFTPKASLYPIIFINSVESSQNNQVPINQENLNEGIP